MSAPIGWVAGKNDSMIAIIEKLNLTANLKLCLDAGDINSYPGSGTKWLDTSGNGYDFDFGDGSTSSTYPTFNGSAGGLSASEYFSFDGDDYFSYDSANETWMNELHNAGVSVSLVAVIECANVGYYFCTTSGTGAGHYGARLFSFAPSSMITTIWSVQNQFSASSLTLSTNCFYEPTNSKMAITGFSNTENSGTTCDILVKGVTQQPITSVLSQSSANTPEHCVIGCRPDLSAFSTTSRMACLAIWKGSKLTKAELQVISNALSRRFQ